MNTRRKFLTGTLATSIGSLAATITPATAKLPSKPSPKPKDSFRILHFTDAHIRPEYEAPRRFTRIIKEALAKAGKIDLALNGGDVIYAADYRHIKKDRVLKQWDIYDKTIKAPLKDIEMLSALGNHDMWWATKKDDTMYGKDYVLQRLGQKSRYMHIERGGWVIATLDCNNGGLLDKKQLEWLHALQKEHSGKPMLIMSHQPLLLAEDVYNKGASKRTMEIVKPFLNHSSTSAPVHFLSGHIHILDTLSFKNLHFHCNGAISGAWWEPHIDEKNCSVKGTPMGYAIIDIFPDGRFNNVYHDVTDCKDGKIIK